jgi:hypothetical protein
LRLLIQKALRTNLWCPEDYDQLDASGKPKGGTQSVTLMTFPDEGTVTLTSKKVDFRNISAGDFVSVDADVTVKPFTAKGADGKNVKQQSIYVNSIQVKEWSPSVAAASAPKSAG